MSKERGIELGEEIKNAVTDVAVAKGEYEASGQRYAEAKRLVDALNKTNSLIDELVGMVP